MIPFGFYAAYLGLVKKQDIFEEVLMGASAFVALSTSLWISAKKIESQKINSDLRHSVMLNLFCYYLFGLFFMIFESLPRINPFSAFYFDSTHVGRMLGLTLGMTFFYFFIPAVIFGLWWMVPLHLYWMKRYRARMKARGDAC